MSSNSKLKKPLRGETSDWLSAGQSGPLPRDVTFIKILGATENLPERHSMVAKDGLLKKAFPLLDRISFIFGCLSFSAIKEHNNAHFTGLL
jgi:hypothetical protein